MDGIEYGEAFLNELNHTYNILSEKSPTHIITFGGDCSVSQAPFDYLKGKYGKNIVIIWYDAHPDVSGPNIWERFPTIIDSTVIDWLQFCTEEGLTSIA